MPFDPVFDLPPGRRSRGLQLQAGVLTRMGIAESSDMTPDGFNWDQSKSIFQDSFGKIVIWCQPSLGLNRPIVSNDNAATWTAPTLTGWQNAGGDLGIRWSVAYDNIHDQVYAIGMAAPADSGAIVRRYTIARDGSNNITGFGKDAGVNVLLEPGTGMDVATRHATISFIDDDRVNRPHGMVVCVYGVGVFNGGNYSACTRASRRVLSNSAADGVVGNWTDLAGGGAVGTLNGYSSAAKVTQIGVLNQTGLDNVVAHPSTVVMPNGNLLIAWAAGGSVNRLKAQRATYTGGASGTWALVGSPVNGPLLDPDGDGGVNTYSLKFELLSEGRWVPQSSKVVFSFSRWAPGAGGDTWSAVLFDPATDTWGSVVDVLTTAPSDNSSQNFVTGSTCPIPTKAGILVAATTLPAHAVKTGVLDPSTLAVVDPLANRHTASPFDIPVLYPLADNSVLCFGRDFNPEVGTNPPTYRYPDHLEMEAYEGWSGRVVAV